MPKPLYNPNDGITGRDGGPYLDEVETVEAEKRRAVVEGRKPNLEKPPASAGIQLSTASQMLHAVEVNRPSKQHTFDDESERMFDAASKDKATPFAQKSAIPDVVFEEPKAEPEADLFTNNDKDK